jgi:hypothetical protein
MTLFIWCGSLIQASWSRVIVMFSSLTEQVLLTKSVGTLPTRHGQISVARRNITCLGESGLTIEISPFESLDFSLVEEKQLEEMNSCAVQCPWECVRAMDACSFPSGGGV